ncbi:hypothetical protein BJ912DRAFT_1047345 [Pholiota molesta]|nr:hypothetical protein BJ912DRAFT_1047345 [Pholiota molesta]
MDLLKNLQNLALSDDKNTSDHHASPPVTAPPKHDSVLNKLSDALNKSHPTPPPPSSPILPQPQLNTTRKAQRRPDRRFSPTHARARTKEKRGHFSKIGDAISGTRRRRRRRRTRISSTSSRMRSLARGSSRQAARTRDKINSAFGGGAKGEANEDTLDKAIDLFQEHVLKQGPQNNESAIEQAKDEKIASTIKNVLGHKK